MYAWHFVPENRTLKDGNTVEAGYVYEITPTVEEPLVMCQWGLHASRRIIDALEYAPGPVLCRVRLSGQIIEGTDKLVAQRREVLWVVDARPALHEFACCVAEDALQRERDAGREPDVRSWAAIKAKRRWLAGDLTAQELAAARDAARAAARAAAWAAARDAAWAAARAAAWAAARDAAWAAARDAARGAAWDAARAAEIAKQETILTRLVRQARRRENRRAK